jgi:hypothetical protein
VRAHEVLRDVGTEGPFGSESLVVLLGHASAPIRYFNETHDFPNLGRSLIALANIYRLAEDDRQAVQKFLWAFHILNEKCDSRHPSVARLLHQVRFWRLRYSGWELDRCRIKCEIAQLKPLAEQVNDPCIWVEHYREEAGFANYLLTDVDLASERLQRLGKAWRELKNHTTVADPAVLTPRIHLLFDTKRDEEAIAEIQRGYVPLYLRCPNVMSYRRILRWSKGRKFKIAVPPPEFASAFLSYLPRRSNQIV